MINVAIIGAGGMGNIHAQAYAAIPDVRIIAVADLLREKALKITEKYGAKAYLSLDDLLSHEKPDIVTICTPSDLHAAMTLTCLQHKIHVLCEKPIALDVKQAANAVAAAGQNGVKLMIAQVIRFWPEYMYLRHAVLKQTYGPLRQLWISRLSATPTWSPDNWFLNPARSGLAFYDLHIHDVDYIYHLLGRPQAVSSTCFQSVDHMTSYIKTRYTYPGEVLVEAEGSWYRSCMPFSAGYRAVFDDTVLTYQDKRLMVYPNQARPEELHLDQGQLISDSGINLSNLGPYANEVNYFVNCVRNNRPIEIAPPEESLESLKVLTKELESAHKGHAVHL
jgi:predicted dehydrogenase